MNRTMDEDCHDALTSFERWYSGCYAGLVAQTAETQDLHSPTRPRPLISSSGLEIKGSAGNFSTLSTAAESKGNEEKPPTSAEDALLGEAFATVNRPAKINSPEVVNVPEMDGSTAERGPVGEDDREKMMMSSPEVTGSEDASEIRRGETLGQFESTLKFFRDKSFRLERYTRRRRNSSRSTDASCSVKRDIIDANGLIHLRNLLIVLEQLEQVHRLNKALKRRCEFLRETRSLVKYQNAILLSEKRPRLRHLTARSRKIPTARGLHSFSLDAGEAACLSPLVLDIPVRKSHLATTELGTEAATGYVSGALTGSGVEHDVGGGGGAKAGEKTILCERKKSKKLQAKWEQVKKVFSGKTETAPRRTEEDAAKDAGRRMNRKSKRYSTIVTLSDVTMDTLRSASTPGKDDPGSERGPSSPSSVKSEPLGADEEEMRLSWNDDRLDRQGQKRPILLHSCSHDSIADATLRSPRKEEQENKERMDETGKENRKFFPEASITRRKGSDGQTETVGSGLDVAETSPARVIVRSKSFKMPHAVESSTTGRHLAVSVSKSTPSSPITAPGQASEVQDDQLLHPHGVEPGRRARAAWDKVKDIIHTRRESFKLKGHRQGEGHSKGEGNLKSYEHHQEEGHQKGAGHLKSQGRQKSEGPPLENYPDNADDKLDNSGPCDVNGGPNTSVPLSSLTVQSEEDTSQDKRFRDQSNSPSRSTGFLTKRREKSLSPATRTGARSQLQKRKTDSTEPQSSRMSTSPQDLYRKTKGPDETSTSRRLNTREKSRKKFRTIGRAKSVDTSVVKFTEDFINKMEEWEKKQTNVATNSASSSRASRRSYVSESTSMDANVRSEAHGAPSDRVEQLSESFSRTVENWEKVRGGRTKSREYRNGARSQATGDEARSRSRERAKSAQRMEKELIKIERKEQKLEGELQKLAEMKNRLEGSARDGRSQDKVKDVGKVKDIEEVKGTEEVNNTKVIKDKDKIKGDEKVKSTEKVKGIKNVKDSEVRNAEKVKDTDKVNNKEKVNEGGKVINGEKVKELAKVEQMERVIDNEVKEILTGNDTSLEPIECTTRQATDNSCQKESTTHQATDNSCQGESTTHQATDNSCQGEGTTHQATDNSCQVERTEVNSEPEKTHLPKAVLTEPGVRRLQVEGAKGQDGETFVNGETKAAEMKAAEMKAAETKETETKAVQTNAERLREEEETSDTETAAVIQRLKQEIRSKDEQVASLDRSMDKLQLKIAELQREKEQQSTTAKVFGSAEVQTTSHTISTVPAFTQTDLAQRNGIETSTNTNINSNNSTNSATVNSKVASINSNISDITSSNISTSTSATSDFNVSTVNRSTDITNTILITASRTAEPKAENDNDTFTTDDTSANLISTCPSSITITNTDTPISVKPLLSRHHPILLPPIQSEGQFLLFSTPGVPSVAPLERGRRRSAEDDPSFRLSSSAFRPIFHSVRVRREPQLPRPYHEASYTAPQGIRRFQPIVVRSNHGLDGHIPGLLQKPHLQDSRCPSGTSQTMSSATKSVLESSAVRAGMASQRDPEGRLKNLTFTPPKILPLHQIDELCPQKLRDLSNRTNLLGVRATNPAETSFQPDWISTAPKYQTLPRCHTIKTDKRNVVALDDSSSTIDGQFLTSGNPFRKSLSPYVLRNLKTAAELMADSERKRIRLRPSSDTLARRSRTTNDDVASHQKDTCTARSTGWTTKRRDEKPVKAEHHHPVQKEGEESVQKGRMSLPPPVLTSTVSENSCLVNSAKSTTSSFESGRVPSRMFALFTTPRTKKVVPTPRIDSGDSAAVGPTSPIQVPVSTPKGESSSSSNHKTTAFFVTSANTDRSARSVPGSNPGQTLTLQAVSVSISDGQSTTKEATGFRVSDVQSPSSRDYSGPDKSAYSERKQPEEGHAQKTKTKFLDGSWLTKSKKFFKSSK